MNKIFITGSYGNLGSKLVEIASGLDIETIRLNRLWVENPERFQVFALNNFSRGDLFLHLGWDTKNKTRNAQLRCANATSKLSSLCRERGVNFIFISTHLSNKSSKSNYAKFKKIAELAVKHNFGKVIRLGLVLSKDTLHSHPVFRALRVFPFLVSIRGDEGLVPITYAKDFNDYFLSQLSIWKGSLNNCFNTSLSYGHSTFRELQCVLYSLDASSGHVRKRVPLIVNPHFFIFPLYVINRIDMALLCRFSDPLLNLLTGARPSDASEL